MAAEADIGEQLRAFARAKTGDPAAEVRAIHPLPGHAGQSYGFELEACGKSEKLVLRVAPPGVRIAGTADIARQGRIMASLAETAVPVPAIRWLDGDPRAHAGTARANDRDASAQPARRLCARRSELDELPLCQRHTPGGNRLGT